MKRFHSPALAVLGLAAAALLAQPTQGMAQSAYGCTGLDQDKELPSIEGKDGVFYRIAASLRMDHSFSDRVVADLAELSRVLAENGTTLIYVPVPAKSLLMPEFLPDEAALYGFDVEIATAVYHDILDRLTKAGVVTVDIREAIVNRPADVQDLPFYKADFHWSASGASLAAQAIAETIKNQPGYGDLDRATFETTPQEVGVAFSGMRRILQNRCLETLPQAETMTYTTTRIDSAEPTAGAGLDLFGDAEETVPLALAGTSFSDSPINNFPGFLSDFAELELVNYALTGGDQFGAMTSYLTSAEFQDARPRFLVWENPIYNNLAEYGDQPMRELIAAAGATCDTPLDVVVDDALSQAEVDLSGLDLGPDDTLFVDTHRSVGLTTEFRFRSAEGVERSKTIVRGERLIRTGRFYMPLTGLWDDGAQSVTVSMSAAFAAEPSIFACISKKEEES